MRKTKAADEERALGKILDRLKEQAGIDFRQYKPATVGRRIRKRMRERGATRTTDYEKLLRTDAEEVAQLARSIFVAVTGFFRDEEAWRALDRKAVGPIVAASREEIRVWVPACASGEEAYSVAMLFLERLAKTGRRTKLTVFASDISQELLRIARTGLYTEKSVAPVPPERLARFFERKGRRYVVKEEVRDCMVFAQHNLLEDPPFSRIDLVVCRNLLIYLRPDAQERLLEDFRFALRDEGFLFLGSSEGLGTRGAFFSPVSKKRRLYRAAGTPRPKARVHAARALLGVPPPPSPAAGRGERRPVVEAARQILLRQHGPAAALVDGDFEVLHFFGRKDRYFELPEGEPSRALVDLLREGLRVRVRSAAAKVRKGGRAQTIHVHVRREGGYQPVRVTVRPLSGPGVPQGLLLIVFEDEGSAKKTPRGSTRAADEAVVRQLEDELRTTRDELRATIEAMEGSHEEVMSANEELQSMNEELETSSEEMRSLNEELTMVNAQLQEANDELEAANNDLANLLANADVPKLFLDSELRVRRFTPAMQDLLGLAPGDEGRPIMGFARGFFHHKLLTDARKVLADLQPVERQLHAPGGRSYLRRARPYRTEDGGVQGVVVTLSDVTELQHALDRLRLRERGQAAVAALGIRALQEEDLDAFLKEACVAVSETLGDEYAKILELLPGGDRIVLRAGVGWRRGLVSRATYRAGADTPAGYTLASDGPVIVRDLVTETRFSDPELLRDHAVRSGMSVLIRTRYGKWGVIGTYTTKLREFNEDDVHFLESVAHVIGGAVERRQAQAELRASEAFKNRMLEASADAILVVDRAGTVRFANRAAARLVPVGSPWLDLWADPAPLREALERAREGGAGEVLAQSRAQEPRWWSVVLSPLGEEGDARYLAVMRDVTEKRRAQAQMRSLFDAGLFGVVLAQTDGRIVQADDYFLRLVGRGRAEVDAGSLSWRDLTPPEYEDRDAEALAQMQEHGRCEPYEKEFLRGDGTRAPVLLGFTRLDERLSIGFVLDVTEQKRAAERQQMLLAELNHRVKNTLATVQSIAAQTLRASQSLEEFREAFDGRLRSLARTHGLLSRTSWEGADLGTIVRQALEPYGDDGRERIHVEGPRIALKPQAALVLSLVFHELATNAAKYGALSTGGRVSVRWEAGNGRLRLRWTERGGPAVSAPARRGLGSELIERSVGYDLDGQAAVRYGPEGVEWDIEASMRELAPA